MILASCSFFLRTPWSFAQSLVINGKNVTYNGISGYLNSGYYLQESEKNLRQLTSITQKFLAHEKSNPGFLSPTQAEFIQRSQNKILKFSTLKKNLDPCPLSDKNKNKIMQSILSGFVSLNVCNFQPVPENEVKNLSNQIAKITSRKNLEGLIQGGSRQATINTYLSYIKFQHKVGKRINCHYQPIKMNPSLWKKAKAKCQEIFRKIKEEEKQKIPHQQRKYRSYNIHTIVSDFTNKIKTMNKDIKIANQARFHTRKDPKEAMMLANIKMAPYKEQYWSFASGDLGILLLTDHMQKKVGTFQNPTAVDLRYDNFYTPEKAPRPLNLRGLNKGEIRQAQLEYQKKYKAYLRNRKRPLPFRVKLEPHNSKLHVNDIEIAIKQADKTYLEYLNTLQGRTERSKKPGDKLKDLVSKHPLSVGKYLARNPQYSSLVCTAVQEISEDEAKRMRNKRILDLVLLGGGAVSTVFGGVFGKLGFKAISAILAVVGAGFGGAQMFLSYQKGQINQKEAKQIRELAIIYNNLPAAKREELLRLLEEYKGHRRDLILGGVFAGVGTYRVAKYDALGFIRNKVLPKKLLTQNIKTQRADDLYQSIAKDKKLVYCLDTGCDVRAHHIARQLEKNGIEAEKIFVQGVGRDYIAQAFGQVTKFKLKGKIGDNVVHWRDYHAAVKVRVNGRDMVWDAGTFDGPVPIEQWKAFYRQFSNEVKFSVRSRFVKVPEADAKSWGFFNDARVRGELDTVRRLTDPETLRMRLPTSK